MNKLKKYAGLLNEEAPENHFLAYITPSERDMLVDAGGVKTPTPSGIFAYPPSDNYGGTHGSSSSSSNRDTGSDYGQFDRAVSRAANNPSPSVSSGNDGNNNNYKDRIRLIATTPETVPGFRGEGGTDERGDVGQFDQRSDLAKTGDAILDFFKSGGIIGNVFGALNDFAKNYNKKRRNNFMSTADIKAYELGTGKNWNPNLVTNVNSDEYKYLKNETNYFDQFNSEDNRNENDPSSFFDNPQDMASQNIINNPNPFSQVNTYFNNMGTNNLGISNNFLTTYNKAKDDLAKTLNMTTNASQFGYNANMSSSNIYYNYLKDEGLL